MTKWPLAAAILTALVASNTAALAEHDEHHDRPLTLAVFGDWPYNQNLLTNAPLLINSVNADRDVSLVLHVGDIHSGSMACTSAGILPPIATAVPDWNDGIYNRFQQFQQPVIYTPGDNEWTDCHKTKEFKSGAPLKELANVRSLFFARPSHSLGLADKEVWTQAQHFNVSHPEDAQFVENVMWEDASVLFVTVNMPGSNNDTLPWTNGFGDATAQAAEVAGRTAADIRWLQSAFALAQRHHDRAVVIAQQADMWDVSALATGGDGLSAYTPFVQALADAAAQFAKPVLLLNGDSHLYEADHPLVDAPLAAIHGTQSVPNLTRITVQGSTNAPGEWLKLKIDPRNPSVFSWTNVSYCLNPTGACQ